MKSLVKLFLFFAVLFIASCTQPTDMLTVINSDGSCYREFAENADSAFLMGDISYEHNPFVTDIDSTWKIAWSFKNSGLRTDFPLSKTVFDSISKITTNNSRAEGKTSKEHILVFARRNYKSVDEMDSTFKLKCSNEWSDLKVKHSLEMKFRWFYTFYTYREIYPKIETKMIIPIEKYLSHSEAMYWFTGEPNIMAGLNGVETREYAGEIETKFRQWFNENTWDAEYKVLLANYDKMKNPPVSKIRLANLMDTIFKAKVNQAEEFKVEHILDDYFKTNAFSTFWKAGNSPMGKYEKDLNEQGFVKYFSKYFTYKLLLPGKITRPNNAVVQGDTLVWKLSAYRMIPADYVIEAQSRKANVWAFILTGLILIVAVGSLVWKPKRG